MKSIADIEDALLTDAYFENPYPVFDRLRREAPVYWSDKLASWLITRYEDCEAVIGDAETFSSSGRVAYLLDQLPADMQATMEPLRRHYAVGLAHSDPPAHTRLRNILRKIVNPGMARARTGRVRELVIELLERLPTDEPIDFIARFAYPLPATVVAEVLGAPVQDIARFKAWADDIAGLFEYGGKMTVAAAERGVTSLAGIRAYILDLLGKARGSDDGTIISILANTMSEEDQLEEQEIISTLVTLFVAGHETTTNLLGISMKALLDHPELTAELRQNPDLIPAAVREFLRYEAIVPRAWRMATRDLDMHGQPIRKGQMVMAMLGSANRDPAVFEHPDRIDIRRPGKRHFGFGSGIHICLGAPLARVEGAVAVGEILERYPSFEYSGEAFGWRHDMALRGLGTLPIVLRPG